MNGANEIEKIIKAKAYQHALDHIDNGDCEDECRGIDEKEIKK